MSIFFNLLNGYAFIVVKRGVRESGRGYIIKRLPTLEECKKMAKELSDEDPKNNYWAMPLTDY
jgi:hypothetical protein